MHFSPGHATRLLLAIVFITSLLAAHDHTRPALAAATATSFFVLTDDNRIAALTDGLPSQLSTPVAITGLAAGENLVAIDVRPQNGQLYGLGFNSGTGSVQLYLVSPLTGVATAIGVTGSFVAADGVTPVTIGIGPNTRFGMDFNPAADRIRVVTNTGQNFRISPTSGAVSDGDLGGAPGSVAGVNMDGPISGGTTTVDGAAYTNNTLNTAVTTLYTLDSTTNSLFIQFPPNAGTQASPLAVTLNGSPLDFAAPSGFDIPIGVNADTLNAAASGPSFALLTVGGALGLYRIELSSGAATLVGSLGPLSLRGLAVWEPLPIGNALSADGSTLLRFLLDSPGTVSSAIITSVGANETLVGIDGRPATGQLYGLGVNPTANTATLYRIDPQLGAAAVVGAANSIAFVDAAGNPVDLPDPATVGYGIDFNPTVDRLRVTTGSGLNFRVNPNNGQPIDGNLNILIGPPAGINPDGTMNGLPGGSTGVEAAAYTNSYGQPLTGGTTTQYTLDAASNQLFIQNPPNAGTQTSPLAVTLGGSPLDFSGVNGLDIPPGPGVATSGAAASGSAYTALTVGGSTGLYRLDLASGAATLLGAIGGGATPLGGLVAWSDVPVAELSAPALTVSEGAGSVSLSVRSTGGAPMIASYVVEGGSATAGSDYTAISGTFMLGNIISQTLSLPIIDDSLAEGDETLTVELLGADGVAQAITLTIQDNDTKVAFSAASYAGSELSGTALLTVTLNLTPTTNISVSYASADGSAIAGSDYTPISGTLTFAPGEVSKTLSVPILSDKVIDDSETFSVTLSAPVGVGLGTPSSAQVTIADNPPEYKLFLPVIKQ